VSALTIIRKSDNCNASAIWRPHDGVQSFWTVFGQMCTTHVQCIQNSDTSVGFGDPNVHMVPIFWRLVDMHYVTVTSDYEHVSHVVLHSGIIFTKFELGQLSRLWLTTFFTTDMLHHTVTLTFDSMTLNMFLMYQLSLDQTLYQISAKSNNPS